MIDGDKAVAMRLDAASGESKLLIAKLSPADASWELTPVELTGSQISHVCYSMEFDLLVVVWKDK